MCWGVKIRLEKEAQEAEDSIDSAMRGVDAALMESEAYKIILPALINDRILSCLRKMHKPLTLTPEEIAEVNAEIRKEYEDCLNKATREYRARKAE